MFIDDLTSEIAQNLKSDDTWDVIRTRNRSISNKELLQYLMQEREVVEYKVIVDNRSVDSLIDIICCLYDGVPYTVINDQWPREKKQAVKSDFKRYMSLKKEIDIAYILYTSGSTGDPKGVCIKRSSLFSLLNNIRAVMGCDNDRHLAVTPLSFDLSVHDTISPICKGMSIYLCDIKERSDPDLIRDIIMENKITHLATTPSNYALYHQYSSSNIKSCVVGGEALTIDVWQRIKGTYPNAKLYNFYGPTEVTVWASYKDLTEEFTNSVGSLFANVYGRINSNGVLELKGDQVSIGYTDEKLTNDAFRQDADGVWYDTGDIAEIHRGELRIIGRKDSQVKRFGHRIELSEIEIIASECIGSKSKVIFKNENLVMFYESTIDKDTIELMNILKKKLPFYSVPDEIHRIEKLPLSENGKADVNELLNTRDKIKENSSIESKSINIWENITGEKVDVGVLNVKLSELGASSIHLVRLIIQYKTNFDLDVPLTFLIEDRTLSEHIEYIKAAIN